MNHVECNVPWSTKETPDNSHTKGSIKVKSTLLTIDNDNNAKLSPLTMVDKFRLRNQRLGVTRIIVGNSSIGDLREVLKNNGINHSPIKSFSSTCGRTMYVTDIMEREQMLVIELYFAGDSGVRILMPNEEYYKMYDDPKFQGMTDIDLDVIDYPWDDDEED